ncbi:hypothetical protein F5050DRAFT_1857301 [Lentinula boryana]|uniref:Uncharacterized protein n=1 Tax=Lentinula boryana TaxID=40481 RepID=A0ABQ8Q1V5_9AGAR|nr:hypothetical protein F5050DRAFT_1857301 [Lentinula boryana]
MYESKAEHADIFENQRTLPLNLMTALCGLTEGGSVGPCEVVCLVGFRNEENFVASWRLNVHHQVDENGDPFTPEFQHGSDNERAFNSLDRAWAEYCETVLPKHRAPGPQNAQGVPVLRDTTDLSNKQLAQEIVDFLNQIWQYSQPAHSRSCFVPLSEIDSNPQAFYDTSKFQFPTSLAVERLSNSQLWLLGDYISSISNIDHPDPFVFKSKDHTTLSVPNVSGGSSSMIPGPVAVAQESSASATEPATQPSDVQGMGEPVNSCSPATASTQDELTKSSTVPNLETTETTNTGQQVRLPLPEGGSPISPNLSTTLEPLPVPPILSVTIALPTASCNPSTPPVTTTPSFLPPLSETAPPPDDTPTSSNSTTSPDSSMTTTTNSLTAMSQKAPPPDGTPAVDPPADIESQPKAIHTGLASVDAPKRRGKCKAAAAQLDDTQGTRVTRNRGQLHGKQLSNITEQDGTVVRELEEVQGKEQPATPPDEVRVSRISEHQWHRSQLSFCVHCEDKDITWQSKSSIARCTALDEYLSACGVGDTAELVKPAGKRPAVNKRRRRK